MRSPWTILDDWLRSWRSLPARSRRRLMRAAIFLLVVDCSALILTYTPFLVWFAHQFRVEDPLLESDAIVFLLGATDRSSKAADLYRRGLAPVVLMSPTDDAWHEAEIHRGILSRKGVPAEAVRVLPGEIVQGTHDEALRVRDYVKTHPTRRITVVTSAYHSARTRWTFQRVLDGLGVEVRMAASDPHGLTEYDWYKHINGIKIYLSEIIKSVYYKFAY